MARRAKEAPGRYDPQPEPGPRFLTVEEVLHLHRRLIAETGGDPGLMHPAALESAVAQPAMTAFGQLIHPTLVDQAAAYLFHLATSHPFCDGNQRLALHAALVFLDTNGATILGTGDEWHRLSRDVATGTVRKAETARRLATLVQVPPA